MNHFPVLLLLLRNLHAPCASQVRALCEAVAVLLSKNMTCTRPRCNATPSKHFPHTSHCTLHTLHFALHTCTSSQLISSELFSSHFMSSHMSAKFLSVQQSLHKTLPSTTLYYKACTNYFPVLLCTTKLAQNTSQYILLCTTQLAQSTSQYYFVLQSLHKLLPSTTVYYKACRNYFPVLLCDTKLAQSPSQYYFVLQSLHKALPSTTLYYKACTKHFPVLLCTTKLAQSTFQYYFVIQSLHKESFYTQQVLSQRSFYIQQAF